jgi:hypothetical protein
LTNYSLRTCAFARHGWKFEKIQYVVPNKGVAYYGTRSTTASMRRRIWAIFIEKNNLGDTPFVSDRSEDSLMKRFAWIQEQTTKLNAPYDKIKNRKVGVLGVADMMT